MSEATNWKPIETAPKDGTEILVMDSGYNRYVACWTRYHHEPESKRQWYITDGQRIFEIGEYEPALWVPLPEKPGFMTAESGELINVF